MGVSNLRQSSRIHKNGGELLANIDTEQLTIQSLEERRAEALSGNYPYNDQLIYYGVLHYDEQSNFGSGRDIKCDFQYRVESGIFLLKTDVDVSLTSIIGDINSVAPNDFKIYHNISPDRNRLWKFISNAERVIEISFISKSGEEVGLDHFEGLSPQEIADEHPIEAATAVYSYESQQMLVRYSGGSIIIDTEDSNANEYIIQLFERDVIYSQETS